MLTKYSDELFIFPHSIFMIGLFFEGKKCFTILDFNGLQVSQKKTAHAKFWYLQCTRPNFVECRRRVFHLVIQIILIVQSGKSYYFEKIYVCSDQMEGFGWPMLLYLLSI